jgi:uncharacterized damage-inducible protein DinB
MTVERVFLEVAGRRLSLLRDRILACLDKLDEERVWLRGGENENAIGNLVLHLCGNVRQWIGHGVGQLPDIRLRETEFDARGGMPVAELRERLVSTMEAALGIIRDVEPGDLLRRFMVQGYEVTTLEAIFHVTDHFGQHTGQIILLTKHATGEDLGFYRQLSAAGHGEKTP